MKNDWATLRTRQRLAQNVNAGDAADRVAASRRLAALLYWNSKTANQPRDLAKILAVSALDQDGELLDTVIVTLQKRAFVDLSLSL
jgi:hypothetical protein